MENLTTMAKRIIKISVVVMSIIAFLFIYDTYLINRSLINLNTALNLIKQARELADIEKIEPFLKTLLYDEIRQKRTDLSKMAKLEFIRDISVEPEDKEQLEDIKFFLTNEIQVEKENRPALLNYLDRAVSAVAIPTLRKTPESRLRTQAHNIIKNIVSTKDADKLQKIFFDLGAIYIELEEYTKAQEAFLEVIEFNPKSILAMQAEFYYAWVNMMQKKYDTAITNFKQFIREYPGTEMAVYSQFQIGDLLKKKARFFEAIDIFRSLISEYPGSIFSQLAQFQIGYIYLYNLKDYQLAIDTFGKIRSEVPSTTLAKHIGQQVEPRIAMYYENLGYVSLTNKKYEQAIEQFSLALQIDPDLGSCYAGEGIAYLWLGQKNKSLEKAKMGKELTPRDPLVLVNLGYIYIYLGMLDEAVTEYKELLSFYPRSKEAHYNLGYVYALKGDLGNALSEFIRAVEIDPKFALAYNNIGYILWHQNRYSKAIVEFKRVTQMMPDYSAAHFNLALAYMMQGRLSDAKKEFELVIKINPGDSVAIANLRQLERMTESSR